MVASRPRDGLIRPRRVRHARPAWAHATVCQRAIAASQYPAVGVGSRVWGLPPVALLHDIERCL